MTDIRLLNPVSPVWREVLSPEEYHLIEGAPSPRAIIVRSTDMHGMALPETVLAVGRAGVGVNNIPLDEYAEMGVPVFNTPGANANAVKELVIAALLLASRDIAGGIAWAKGLQENGASVEKQVEKGKKAFAGPELAGKTLGVVGLGAIGLMVANAGVALGMKVLGYDPYISIDNAWKLSRAVAHAQTLDEALEKSDYVTVHVPLTDETRGAIDAETLSRMKPGAALINFARGELVDTGAVLRALETGALRRYVCDFPTEALLRAKNCVCLPHLGASTPESEDNCVRMIARQLDAYLKTGALTHCVNFPDADPGRLTTARLVVLHRNVPSVVSSITALISRRGINISNMLNRSRGAYAVTFLDLDECPPAATAAEIEALPTICRARILTP